MKLVIGICDDDALQVDVISGFLEKSISNCQLELVKAYSGEMLLSKLESKAPDVVFLDMEMEGMNGLETGKYLREKYPDIIIIFVTGYKNFALEAFQINTMDYLIKPVSEARLDKVLKNLLLRLDQIKLYEEKNKTVTFSFRDNTIKLKFNEIYFFEKNLRKITVCSDKGMFSFYESMEELLSKLDLGLFIKCHNSFIVNKSKIIELKNDSIYIREFDRTIPVSRKNKADVKEVFERNIFI